jgi:hypothetical protein
MSEKTIGRQMKEEEPRGEQLGRNKNREKTEIGEKKEREPKLKQKQNKPH